MDKSLCWLVFVGLQHMVFLLPFKDSILDWLLASL